MHQLSSSRDVSFRDLPCDVRGSGSEQFRFSSCASTWRECQPGDLFIAITRADSDGHDDVDEARRRGAVAVLAERYLPTDLPVFLTEDTREAYGHICHALAGHPTREMHGIGIAGTSGKTSTARHLNAILRAAGRLSVSATDERWFDPQPMESRPVTTARTAAFLPYRRPRSTTARPSWSWTRRARSVGGCPPRP